MNTNQTIPASVQDIAALQQDCEGDILERPNVVGVAIGTQYKQGQDTGKKCISALVSTKLDKSMLAKADLVPTKIKDTAVDVVEVGDIFAGDFDYTAVAADELAEAPAWQQNESPAGEFVSPLAATSNQLTRRIRPAQGGFSVGHYKVTAGTLGTCCYDLAGFPGVPNKYYILSNNHVLANSNDARIGDPILQPGRYDGGVVPRDVIAHLSRYVPIHFHTPTSIPTNYVDAAIAEGDLADLNREVYWGGHVKGLYAAPNVNDIVQKTGRTTGFTTGRITNINATVDVNYGSGRIARFKNQIITTRMGAPGDSGSLVMNRDEHAVGLLFAGSATRTIINNIMLVQMLLKVRLHEK